MSKYNGVVHSKHFWLIFGFIFGSFSRVWQKNDQNDPKNDMKNDMKNGYREHPGKQKPHKWSKNAFYMVFGSAGKYSAHSNSTLKDLVKFFLKLITKMGTSS